MWLIVVFILIRVSLFIPVSDSFRLRLRVRPVFGAPQIKSLIFTISNSLKKNWDVLSRFEWFQMVIITIHQFWGYKDPILSGRHPLPNTF